LYVPGGEEKNPCPCRESKTGRMTFDTIQFSQEVSEIRKKSLGASEIMQLYAP